jgi:hypothetical protein
MTHDELLAKIMNKRATVYEDDIAVELADALRAVVEMCKPSDWDNDDNFYWKKALLETIGRELS